MAKQTPVLDSLQVKKASFTFKVPADLMNADGSDKHPDAGKKFDKVFDYPVCNTEAEATSVIAEKEWSVLEMVNDALKANARSNAYQSSLAAYRPSTVTPDEIKERMIRDYIRLGIAEEIARKQVEALLSASNG